MSTKGKEGGYSYKTLLLIVVVSWGIVPSFAKLGNLPGDVTTLWVNWIALAAVAALITIQGKWQLLKEYNLRDYATMVAIGIAWPLMYSVAYFQSVKVGGPALTTILNYVWPVAALVFARALNKARPTKLSIVSVTFATAAVGLVCFFEHDVIFATPAIALGLLAATTQGFYSAATDRWKYNPWVMTLIVEAVTVVGVTILVALRGSFVLPPPTTLFYLGVIGAISNGIGFWAFLAGSRRSGECGVNVKCTWLIGMCFVPFAQVLITLLLGVEKVSPWKWVGIVLVTISFLVHKTGNIILERIKEAL